MKNSMKYLFGFGVAAILTAFDQYTKHLAVSHLKGQKPIVLWEQVFELAYLENRGAAFGMFQDKRMVFLLITALVMAATVYAYYKLPAVRHYLPLHLTAIGICSGAVGNMIDRIRNGYVVDFFYFKLIDFPVFNMADIYVVVSAIFLVLLFVFYYKEEELDMLFTHSKQNRNGENRGK